MHHDAKLRSPPCHADCPLHSHCQLKGLRVISVRIQNSEAAECFLMVFLSSGMLLMFSVAHGPKALCKEKRKPRAAVPVACVMCVFSVVLGTICFSSRTTYNETNCVQTGAHTLEYRGAVQCMVIDLVITISKCERYSFYMLSRS